MAARDPQHRVLVARTAALTRWAHEADPVAATAKAREAFEKRFLDEVDPERRLPEDERNRRAARARKAHFTRLALARHRKRLAARDGQDPDEPAA